MELKELKKKKPSEWQRLLREEREKLRDLRFKDANKQLKDVRALRLARKTIARLITLINQERADKEEPAASAGRG